MKDTVVAIGVCCVLAACVDAPDYRGRDHGEVLYAARAAWHRDTPDGERRPPQRFAIAVGVEGGATHAEGDFGHASGRVDYEAVSLHAAFAPRATWHGVSVAPMAGIGHGDIEVDGALGRVHESGTGVFAGVQCGWRATAAVEPYVRYSVTTDLDWQIARFEAGLELLACDRAALLLAYALQKSEIEGPLAPIAGSARVESDGLQLGLALRF